MAELTISRLRQEAPESGELIDKAYEECRVRCDQRRAKYLSAARVAGGVAQLKGGREPVFTAHEIGWYRPHCRRREL